MSEYYLHEYVGFQKQIHSLHEGRSENSKPHPDFRFVVFLSGLYGPYPHTN